MEEGKIEERVGKVVGYFSKIQVAAVEVEGEIKVGDTLHFKGHTTDFHQKVESMQIEKQGIEVAKPGDKIGMKVNDKVRPNDIVYKVVE